MVGWHSHWIAIVAILRVGEGSNPFAVIFCNVPTLYAVGHDCAPAGGLRCAWLEHSLVYIAIVRSCSWNSELIPVVKKSHVVAELVGEYQASTIGDCEGKPGRLVPTYTRRSAARIHASTQHNVNEVCGVQIAQLVNMVHVPIRTVLEPAKIDAGDTIPRCSPPLPSTPT